MKHTKRAHLFSILTAIAFLFFAAGSAKVDKIHCGAFSALPLGESKAETNYVEMNDGSIITGDKITWKSGIILKDQIKINDQKIAIKETRGYYSNGSYFGRLGKSYVKRIVHGKLNVYLRQEYITTTETVNGQMRTRTRLDCDVYVQVGDNGDIRQIGDQKDIREYVKECPTALALIDKKDKEIRRSIRKNPSYLNEIFMIYNNGCKEN
jgi:hypothetical protein